MIWPIKAGFDLLETTNLDTSIDIRTRSCYYGFMSNELDDLIRLSPEEVYGAEPTELEKAEMFNAAEDIRIERYMIERHLGGK
jgi:hypothetical protein